MLSFPSKFFASRLPMNCVPRTHPSPNIYTLTVHKTYSAIGDNIVKIISPFAVHHFSSCMGPCYCRAMPKSIWPVDTPHVVKYYKGHITNSHQQILGNVNSEDDSEVHKISHADKGRVLWNKGRRQVKRLDRKSDRELRKLERPQGEVVNQTKARIRASLTKLWGKHLQWKRSREKFLHSWAESIATAAKMGGSDQQELDWDSYDKITREMAIQQLRRAEEKAKAKERAHIREERAAQVKAEKMAKIAERRREREEKLAEFQEVKLMERLMKIHGKKSILNQAINQRRGSWEKFDLDFVEGGKLQNEVTLADQIRFAKDRRADQQLLN